MSKQLRDAARAARDFLDEELDGLLHCVCSVSNGKPDLFTIDDEAVELVTRYRKIIADLNAGLRASSAVVVALRQLNPEVVAENKSRQGATEGRPGVSRSSPEYCDCCQGVCRQPRQAPAVAT